MDSDEEADEFMGDSKEDDDASESSESEEQIKNPDQFHQSILKTKNVEYNETHILGTGIMICETK